MRVFTWEEIEKLERSDDDNHTGIEISSPFRESVSGRSYLEEAILRGDVQYTRLMLDQLSFLDKEDSRLNHCFYLSLQKGNVDIIQMLIDRGLDVEKAFAHLPYYKLEASKENKNIVVARLLLDAGANINVLTLNRTPFENAVFHHDTEYENFLVEATEKRSERSTVLQAA